MDVDRQCFTVGVFQDVEWAERGLEALENEGLPAESLSLISKETPEAAELVQRIFGRRKRHEAEPAATTA